jgi:hypothetical protein
MLSLWGEGELARRKICSVDGRREFLFVTGGFDETDIRGVSVCLALQCTLQRSRPSMDYFSQSNAQHIVNHS